MFLTVVLADPDVKRGCTTKILRTVLTDRGRFSTSPDGRATNGLSRRHARLFCIAAVTAFAAAGLLLPGPAAAATYTVDNGDGGGPDGSCTAAASDCNLAAAITQSNASPATDAIDFAPSLQGEIDLGADLPTISDGVTIAGPGAGTLAIDGENSHRPMRLAAGGEQVRISGLTIRRGRATAGGAIYVEVTPLALEGMRIEDSEAVSAGSTPARCGSIGVGGIGGAIFARNSAVEINDSVIADSKGSERGGAICLQVGSPLTVTGSEILSSAAAKDGGAIAAFGNSPVTIERSTLADNRTTTDDADGGAIYASDSDVEITQSTLSGNLAPGSNSTGGAVHATGTSRVSAHSSTFTGNLAPDYDFSGAGGAIAAFGGAPLTVEGSSFSGNEAGIGGGGAIRTTVDLVLENSTFFDNSSLYGAAVYATVGQVDIESITATANDNAGGAVELDSGSGGSIRNSILAGNRREAPVFLGSDLVGDSSQTLVVSHTQFGTAFNYVNAGNNILDPDPQLGPLTDNGGPTETMAISTTSSAYNTGSSTEQGDQRGVPRPQNGTDDIGAFELDDTAPGLSIAPVGATSDRTPQISFSSSAPDLAGFECALDGPTQAQLGSTYKSCSSPLTLGPLSDGRYTLRVRATDIARNSATASEAFRVDTTVYRARIGRVTVSGPARVRKRRVATYRVRVHNSGNALARGVRLQVSGRARQGQEGGRQDPGRQVKDRQAQAQAEKDGQS